MSTGTSVETGRLRIAALDIVRGAVMVLMAIDHVRVYSGLPPGGPTPGIFGLGLLYLVTVIAVGMLYVPCRWFAAVKQRSRAVWLSYL